MKHNLWGWRTWLIGLSLGGLAALLILWGRPLAHFLADVQQVRRFVASFGLWAPLALIILEVIQVVLAPVPGGMVELASGYLFGPVWGTLYSMIGLMGGTIIALFLSRRFGRPLVERIIPSRTLNRLDRYTRRRGPLFFLLLLLIPFLAPTDALCFLAGLTPLPLIELILIAVIGRLPGALISNLIGANAGTLIPLQLLLIGAPLLLVSLTIWRYREQIEGSLLQLLTRLGKLTSGYSIFRRAGKLGRAKLKLPPPEPEHPGGQS
ncbi:MAG: VTT domain-containing protein [Chloroflexota bacterium]|nr:VTT domain-containing protein [Chloroflexota bacterium]